MTQKEALDLLKLGRNVYLTGQAGSGKTYLLNQYIDYLRDKKISVAVTASTGIAATHMNGVTIHSWSGLGIRDRITDKDLERIRTRRYLRQRIQSAKVLIIDEVSMLHPEQFDGVSRICQMFRYDQRPFGGLQVICSGDFFQLPPVKKRGTGPVQFVTASETWQTMSIHICYLQEQYRHADPILSEVLNAIRESRADDKTRQAILSREYKEVGTNITPTKLYTHNADVDAINNMELDKITEKKYIYHMHSSGDPKLIDFLKDSCLAPEQLEIKVGAVVMFVQNNFEKGYVNGTLGKVTGYDNDQRPIVMTYVGREIVATPAKWAIEDEDGNELASISQIPLRLAWAITVHKSQGMTLDAAEVDLSKSFVEGMGYVALSRIRTLQGLKLMGLNDTALQVNQQVVEMDKKLLQQSVEVRHYIRTLATTTKEKLQKDFIKQCAL